MYRHYLFEHFEDRTDNSTPIFLSFRGGVCGGVHADDGTVFNC